ncbi:DUF2524 domain-containing protein [Paenibacillus sp.]|uniref:DUF2524 domain-containing protein n=1 Tax=Paenibacillus sp. TaxID=58172 RepID=UPI002D55CE07|nr:DUF2524 domain-containing protein [Paenibacillus sp.]HZG56260.1 DUF2524 domain-containing protein [Paenibacillus sp.]
MLDQLESNYDCANAGDDLPRLLAELDRMKSGAGDEPSKGDIEAMNRLENQIAFIRNKCAIR